MIRTLAQAVPPKWRTGIYSTITTLVAVETTLDGFDYGVIPDRPQSALLAVLVVLGFGVAVGNVPAPLPPPPPPAPEDYPGEFA
jgi:hypothetical protein